MNAGLGPAARSGGLLAQLADHLGHPVPEEGASAARGAPAPVPARHALAARRRRRLRAVRPHHGPRALVAGRVHRRPADHPTRHAGRRVPGPSSSASAPGPVVRMLEDAQLADGMRVLEIGTGTGFHAGLLCARLGDRQVVTVDIDGALVDRARAALVRAGHAPTVRHADGAAGWPREAPYDRIISTCAIRHVPPAWLAQTRTGGRILTPGTPPGSATARSR
ncbi:methyltransferase domain-containing protein [Streptomyces sp. M19]